MKGRKQKISEDTSPQNDRAEPESYVGGQTFMWITENNYTDIELRSEHLLEHVLSPSNLNLVYKQVKKNKGSGGIDQLEVESL